MTEVGRCEANSYDFQGATAAREARREHEQALKEAEEGG